MDKLSKGDTVSVSLAFLCFNLLMISWHRRRYRCICTELIFADMPALKGALKRSFVNLVIGYADDLIIQTTFSSFPVWAMTVIIYQLHVMVVHSHTVFSVGDDFCDIESGERWTPVDLDLSGTSGVYLAVDQNPLKRWTDNKWME